MGGPQVRSTRALAQAYLAAGGRRRPVVSVRLPGRVVAGFRSGHHLTPQRAVGTITFERFLAERFGAAAPSDGPASGERWA